MIERAIVTNTEKARHTLSDNLHKIKLDNADNLNLLEPPEKGDIFMALHVTKSEQIISLPQTKKRQE